jgi:DedD protein
MAETRTEELTGADAQDTEIILSTGKLLGIFFGLVVLCAIFFSMGYLVGHGSSGGKPEIIGNTPTSGSTSGKPSASDKTAVTTPAQPCAAGSANFGLIGSCFRR